MYLHGNLINVKLPFKHCILIIIFVTMANGHLSDLPSFPLYANSKSIMIQVFICCWL